MPGSSLWLIPPPSAPFTRTLNTIITATLPYRFSQSTLPAFIPHITLTSNVPAELYGDDAQSWLDSLELPFATAALSEKAQLESGQSAQEPEEFPIVLDGLQTEDPFFRKLSLRAVTSDPDAEVVQAVATPQTRGRDQQPLAQGERGDRRHSIDDEEDEDDDEADPVSAYHAIPDADELKVPSAPSDPLRLLAAACRAQGVFRGDFTRAREWVREEYRPHLSLMYADLPTKQVETMIPAMTQDLERLRAILRPGRDGVVARGATIVLVPTDNEIPLWKPIARREVLGAVWRWAAT